MTAHSLILSLSAATIIKTFYLIPRKAGLVQKLKFSEESDEELK
jgi:hypothetical protein